MELSLPSKSTLGRVIGFKDFKNPAIWRACVMELCLAWLYICSSITIGIGSNYHDFTSATLPIIAFAHFIVLSLFFRSGCPPSDAHFNPLVTLGAMFSAKYTPVRTLLYIIFQCTGGTLGALCAKHMIPADRVEKYALGGCTVRSLSILQPDGTMSASQGVSDSQAFLAEFIFSFVLQFVTFYTAMDERQFKITTLPFFPFIIAATVSINIYISGGIAPGFGGSFMNPARCFGPAMAFRGRLLGSLWIFLLAPALAALCSAVVYLIIPPDHVEIYREKEDFFHQMKKPSKLMRKDSNVLTEDYNNHNNPAMPMGTMPGSKSTILNVDK